LHSARFTDTASDPYDANRGLWYSHIGWLFEAPPYIEKVKLISMKDLDQDAGQSERTRPTGRDGVDG
jgi:fatty-acid desaturase